MLTQEKGGGRKIEDDRDHSNLNYFSLFCYFGQKVDVEVN